MSKRKTQSAANARIILFGSEGGFSRPVLEQLLQLGLRVIAIVMVHSRPDNPYFPAAVNQPAKPGGLAELAANNNIDILRTFKLDDTLVTRLKEMRADILLAACFAQKIPARIWRDMQRPCWNLHPSLLPAYRGPSPIYWQILHHEANTGLTLHEVTDLIDSGDILAHIIVPLPASHDNQSLNHWVSKNGTKLFYQALLRHLEGTLSSAQQAEVNASYFPAP
jgi:methionyl-tRNA formyltransferase